jgi:hypothetical protein
MAGELYLVIGANLLRPFAELEADEARDRDVLAQLGDRRLYELTDRDLRVAN